MKIKDIDLNVVKSIANELRSFELTCVVLGHFLDHGVCITPLYRSVLADTLDPGRFQGASIPMNRYREAEERYRALKVAGTRTMFEVAEETSAAIEGTT